jgi:PAS domain S-box-containing protein
MKDVVPIDNGALRDRAELAVKKMNLGQLALPQSDADIRKQFHELQVNQVELEMQNLALIELQQVRAETDLVLKRYAELYDFAPIGYFTLDRNGIVCEANLVVASLLAVERARLIGQRVELYLSADARPVFKAFLERVFAQSTKTSCEVILLNAKNQPFVVRLEAIADGSGKTCRTIVEDITLRKLAEESLFNSRKQLESNVQERTAELTRTNQALMQEIAERKRTEQALHASKVALRRLAAYQEHIKEGERKHIAREIHDELGSLLTGIKANASVALDHHERGGKSFGQQLNDIAKLTDQAIETVRKVITELRPSVLDQLGVWAALEWYATQVEQRTTLKCTCFVDAGAIATELDTERSTALFRIVQEALTNVIRHADAKHVTVRATRRENLITVEVADDGKGIDDERQFSSDSWGIAGMYERAMHFDGEFSIGVNPGGGTLVFFRFPLEKQDAR